MAAIEKSRANKIAHKPTFVSQLPHVSLTSERAFGAGVIPCMPDGQQTLENPRATLNSRKFKVVLNPMYRIFLNFAKSCVLSCLSKGDNIKRFHRAVFEL